MTAKSLLFLGGYLILAGLAGYLSNPEGAKTALISGGTFGGLCLVWGGLASRGIRWARWAGLATAGILTVAFIWRSSVGWIAVAGGESDKLFAASLITSMLIATVIAATLILRDKQSK